MLELGNAMETSSRAWTKGFHLIVCLCSVRKGRAYIPRALNVGRSIRLSSYFLRKEYLHS
jgi:hypothetical protein